MDQLTKDFFNNEFPKFNNNIELQSDLLSTNLPIVEVKLNLDVEYLLAVARQISVEEVIRPVYPYEFSNRIKGWSMQLLWSDGTVTPWIKDLYYKVFADPIAEKPTDDLSESIKNKLLKYGISAKVCWVSKFSPQGYLRPHRDYGINPRPLSYFWIPLNAPDGSELKIYPSGTVNVNLGSMYLLNQDNYTHAVVNLSNQDRYVLTGHLTNDLDSQIMSKIKASILINTQ